MENLEQQTQVINLGKLLVKELDLDSTTDTLSRWMAHYIAEKIVLVEQLQGEEKNGTEKECFELILKLWDHRWCLPNGKKPFEDFEPILGLLQKLNPDNPEPLFFVEFSKKELNEIDIEEPDFEHIEYWSGIAQEIDKVARVWITAILEQATAKINKEKTKEWLENSIHVSRNQDVQIVEILFGEDSENRNIAPKDHREKKIKRRIKQLEKFAELNEVVLKIYLDELELLNNSDTST